MKNADFYDWVILGDSVAGQALLSRLAETIEYQPNQHRWRVAWVLPTAANRYYCPSYTPSQLNDLAVQWQAQGIDVITGLWQFIPDHEFIPQDLELGLPLAQWGKFPDHQKLKGSSLYVTESESGSKSGARLIYARHWVAAMPAMPLRPVINLVPPHYVLAVDLTPQIQQVAILGDQPQALPVAQRLARDGYDVTLILQRSRLLPEVDPEISQILQAHLETQGIKVKICGRLTAVQVFPSALPSHRTRLWLGQTILDTECLVLAAPPQAWLAAKYQLPPQVLWCQTSDDARQIWALHHQDLSRFNWQTWLSRWGLWPINPSANRALNLNTYQRLAIATEPPLLHYGVVGTASHRLIVPSACAREDLSQDANSELGIAKIHITDDRIVGFSAIGASTPALGHLMGWLVDQKVPYGQWQKYTGELI